MNYRALFKTTVVLVFLIFLFSCDIFLSNTSSRENPTDFNLPISNFTAYPIGTDRIITTWNRNNFLNKDEQINEIRVVHSSLGYPVALFPFIGESITDSKINQSNWTGLGSDITHYFALYMKDGQGNWYSPIYTKATLPGGTLSPADKPIINAWHVGIDDSSTQPVVDIIGSDVLVGIGQEDAVVIEFDLPEGVTIIYATINPEDLMGLYTESPGNFYIAALDASFSNSDPDFARTQLFDRENQEYLVVEESAVLLSGQTNSWNTYSIDITKAVQAALLTESNQLVFGSYNEWISLKLNFTDFIKIEYITY